MYDPKLIDEAAKVYLDTANADVRKLDGLQTKPNPYQIAGIKGVLDWLYGQARAAEPVAVETTPKKRPEKAAGDRWS